MPTATACATQDGRPLAFTLITQAGFAVRESVAQVLQRQFRDVGVNMSISAARRHQHQPALVRGPLRRDAALVADAGRSGADAVLRRRPHAAGRPQHQLRRATRCSRAWSTRPIARWIIDARKRYLHDAQRRIAELAIEIPLYSVTKLDAVPSTLAGLQGQPHQRRRVLERARVGGAVKSVASCQFIAAFSGLLRRDLRRTEVPVPSTSNWNLTCSYVYRARLPPLATHPSAAADLDRRVCVIHAAPEGRRRCSCPTRACGRRISSGCAARWASISRSGCSTSSGSRRLWRGDWGYSFSDSRPVIARVLERTPATFELVGASLVLAAIADRRARGIARRCHAGDGRTASTRRRVCRGASPFPAFWFGLVLQLLFAVGARLAALVRARDARRRRPRRSRVARAAAGNGPRRPCTRPRGRAMCARRSSTRSASHSSSGRAGARRAGAAASCGATCCARRSSRSSPSSCSTRRCSCPAPSSPRASSRGRASGPCSPRRWRAATTRC